MEKRGRKKGIKNRKIRKIKDGCFFCEGTKFHFGSDCGACDGTGSERVRKQLVNVYNAKNGMKIRNGGIF